MNTSTPAPSRHRARWAAIGAAVAVSLGAGGIGLVNATSPDGASTLVPTEACRLADTRPTQQIGLKTSPFGPGETHVVQTRGPETGQCSPLPNDITAVALNVTAVGASTLTHFTFWASGPLPNSSSLNPAPGQPPTPNAVTTEVANDGSFRVFNFAGNVHLIIDVVGYYTDEFEITGAQVTDESLTGADIDNGSLTGADVNNGSLTGDDVNDGSLTGADVADESLTGADVDNGSLTKADILDEAGVAFNATVQNPGNLQLTAAGETVGSARLHVPADGFVTVQVDINWLEATAGQGRATCQIVKAGDSIVGGDPFFRLNDLGGSFTFYTTTSAHRTFPVSPSDNTGSIIFGTGVTFNVVCEEDAGAVQVKSAYVTAQYFSTDRTPSGIVITIPTFPVSGDAISED